MNAREQARAIVDCLESEEALPVPLKALIAGTLMCARGGSPTRLGMAKVANYSYGSSQAHYAGLLNAIVDRLPTLVAAMTLSDIDPVSASQLRKDLADRDSTISSLRAEVADLKFRREELRKYAIALHQRLHQVDQEAAATTGANVRTLRPLL